MSMYYDKATRAERLSGTARYRRKRLWARLGIYLKFGNFALINLKYFPRY